jgi:hypothetical protein
MSEILVVSGAGKLPEILAEAATALESSGEVHLAGLNNSISRAIEVAEFLKHSISGLHTNIAIQNEEGKAKVSIHLSTRKPATGPGYSAPVP